MHHVIDQHRLLYEGDGIVQQIGRYVVSMVSVALISGVLLAVLPEGSARTLIRFLCGVLMLVSVVSPIKKIEIPAVTDIASDFFQEGKETAEQGSLMARQSRIQRIKETLEEYICVKASELGADLRVTVFLDESETPSGVHIAGNISNETRQEVQTWITKELGIREENQEWTGQTGRMP